MLQVQRLEGFYWVAREGGYARAARAFPHPITQPAVHQQVKKLEGELGVALFERVAKDRVVLTPAGIRLYDFVKPFFEGLPGLVRSMRDGEYSGELRIETSNLLLRYMLPAWIRRLRKQHPRIQVQVSETRHPELAALRRGDVDLVIEHLYEVPDDVATMRVGVVRPYVVLPRSHRLAGKKRVELAALSEDPFISYVPNQRARELQLEALARHSATPPHLLSASSAEGILGLVEAELGWSILPWLDASGPRSKGVVALPLAAPKVDFPVVAAWRKDAAVNPLLDAALETAPRGDTD
ncbi:MAG: LysR family transcriptional regulator [Planctomycetota bacterium]